MKKFTIFSVILAVVVIAMAGQVVVEDYLPIFSDSAELSGADVLNFKLGDDYGTEIAAVDNTVTEVFVDEPVDNFQPILTNETQTEYIPNVITEDPILNNDIIDISFSSGFDPAGKTDFEDINYVASTVNVFLREEQVRAAGFARAYVTDEAHNGFLYKNIFIDDIKDSGLRKFTVQDDSLLYAKVYSFSPGAGLTTDKLYTELLARAKKASNNNINETNQFAKASFYMNDTSRINTAFLTVKFDNNIYGFSYPKEYHNQIVNLIKLIDLEK